jgi:hypothetical protein
MSPVSHGDYWSSKPIVAYTRADRPEVMVLGDAPKTKPRRPKQRDCRYEPPYPGEETVVMSIADPDRVVHADTGKCFTSYPHTIAECKEFVSTNVDDYNEEHRWERVP